MHTTLEKEYLCIRKKNKWPKKKNNNVIDPLDVDLKVILLVLLEQTWPQQGHMVALLRHPLACSVSTCSTTSAVVPYWQSIFIKHIFIITSRWKTCFIVYHTLY